MPKIIYNWSKVRRGDIISFVYKSKEGRRLRRTVLVLEPKLKNVAQKSKIDHLLHGVQLEISNLPTNPEIKKILEAAGTLERVDEQENRYGTIYRVELKGSSQSIYSKLKVLIKRHNLYRTYDIQKASQLYLEDLKLPPSVVSELLNEN